MYFRKASENPDSAAKVAAPIRKLWPLYLVGSSPQWLRTVDKISLNTFRCTGRPSTVQNKGPSERPRGEKYSQLSSALGIDPTDATG